MAPDRGCLYMEDGIHFCMNVTFSFTTSDLASVQTARKKGTSWAVP